jgi:hypothetical protein
MGFLHSADDKFHHYAGLYKPKQISIPYSGGSVRDAVFLALYQPVIKCLWRSQQVEGGSAHLSE